MAQSPAERRVVGQAANGGRDGRGIVRLDDERVDAVAQILRSAAAGGRDDGAPEPHRLQRHEAERLLDH